MTKLQVSVDDGVTWIEAPGNVKVRIPGVNNGTSGANGLELMVTGHSVWVDLVGETDRDTKRGVFKFEDMIPYLR